MLTESLSVPTKKASVIYNFQKIDDTHICYDVRPTDTCRCYLEPWSCAFFFCLLRPYEGVSETKCHWFVCDENFSLLMLYFFVLEFSSFYTSLFCFVFCLCFVSKSRSENKLFLWCLSFFLWSFSFSLPLLFGVNEPLEMGINCTLTTRDYWAMFTASESEAEDDIA